MSDGHATPEEAALGGYPRAYCRVVASRQQDDHAYVLLNTGTDSRRYLYGVSCFRKGGRWFEGSSANGGGWEAIEREPAVGILSFWDDAPEGADRVRIEFANDTREEPVIDGAFLCVWWWVPAGFASPRLVAYRADGAWIVPCPGPGIP